MPILFDVVTCPITSSIADHSRSPRPRLESAYLQNLLERHRRNVSSAAKAGIDRKTFHRPATKHGVR